MISKEALAAIRADQYPAFGGPWSPQRQREVDTVLRLLDEIDRLHAVMENHGSILDAGQVLGVCSSCKHAVLLKRKIEGSDSICCGAPIEWQA